MADFTLLPAVEPLDPDEALAAAQDEALLDTDTVIPTTPPIPLGKSWAFDYSTGQFVRYGDSPAETHGLDTLNEWIVNALLTRRFAHIIYTDSFGLEMDDDLIGNALTPDLETDYSTAVTEALLAHDRIKSVDGFEYDQDPAEDFVVVSFTVTTDTNEQLQVARVPLLTGGAT